MHSFERAMSEMRPASWSEALLTGVEAVDEQHRILFATLEKFEAGDASDMHHLEHVVRDLLAYAVYHFDTEEHLMRRFGFDVERPHEAGAHIREHRSFSRRVVELRADARSGKDGSGQALLEFLHDWLTMHIGSTDRHLGLYIKARRSADQR